MAFSRDDTKTKRVLDSERVCGHHFVSGKAAKYGDAFNFDWVPTLNLGKKQSKTPKESDAEAAKARDERVKERRKHELERQEIEAAKKRKELNQSGLPILDIASTASSFSLYTNLNEPSCSTSCDGDEESDEIIQVDKLTSTDDFEILWEEQKTLKQRQKNSIICLQALYIESETNIILIVLRKLIFTLVYHPMKSL